ncbi:MAG: aminotransferase class IV [Actinobacteria bacterium]|nr:aminotransferase class IV [Actinomycetota bacterium]
MRAWVDDGLVDASEARVSVFDRGFRTGEGVFETLRAYGTHPFRLDAHLERAAAGAETLGFELPSHVRDAVVETTRANTSEGEDLAVRVTVTPGQLDPTATFPPTGETASSPTVVVTANVLRYGSEMYRDGVSATVVPWSREIPQVKAVSYLAASLARREAIRQGADEALLTDQRGMVLEGSYSNVFAVIRGVLVTPPVEAGILAGVTRAVTLDVAAAEGLNAEERPLSVSELVEADEAFLTASTREIVPLVRMAGRIVGNGRPGPVTAALHEGYRGEVRREIEAG